MCDLALPAILFLRHLMAILTASWLEEKIFLLHQSIFSHVFQFYDTYCLYLRCAFKRCKENSLSEQSCRPQMGPMLAPWILLSGYDLLAAGGCCHRKDTMRFLITSGLQPVRDPWHLTSCGLPGVNQHWEKSRLLWQYIDICNSFEQS